MTKNKSGTQTRLPRRSSMDNGVEESVHTKKSDTSPRHEEVVLDTPHETQPQSNHYGKSRTTPPPIIDGLQANGAEELDLDDLRRRERDKKKAMGVTADLVFSAIHPQQTRSFGESSPEVGLDLKNGGDQTTLQNHRPEAKEGLVKSMVGVFSNRSAVGNPTSATREPFKTGARLGVGELVDRFSKTQGSPSTSPSYPTTQRPRPLAAKTSNPDDSSRYQETEGRAQRSSSFSSSSPSPTLSTSVNYQDQTFEIYHILKQDVLLDRNSQEFKNRFENNLSQNVIPGVIIGLTNQESKNISGNNYENLVKDKFSNGIYQIMRDLNQRFANSAEQAKKDFFTEENILKIFEVANKKQFSGDGKKGISHLTSKQPGNQIEQDRKTLEEFLTSEDVGKLSNEEITDRVDWIADYSATFKERAEANGLFSGKINTLESFQSVSKQKKHGIRTSDALDLMDKDSLQSLIRKTMDAKVAKTQTADNGTYRNLTHSVFNRDFILRIITSVTTSLKTSPSTSPSPQTSPENTPKPLIGTPGVVGVVGG